MYELYLAHHGIIGQKWGVRRYQNSDGSLTAAGRLRYAPDGKGGYRKLTGSERRAAEKSAKQKAAALEKARKARAEKAEYEKGKQEAIKSGDASKINKYFNDLNPDEVKVAMDRINTKQRFQEALNKEAAIVSSGETKMDSLMNKVSKATDWADKGIKAYNVIAKISNAFNSDSYLPPIDGTWAGDRKKKLQKEREEEAEKRAEKAEKRKAEREEATKNRVLNTASAADILKYSRKHGNVTAQELGTAIKRMQNEEGLRRIAAGGKEAAKVLKIEKDSDKQQKQEKEEKK